MSLRRGITRRRAASTTRTADGTGPDRARTPARRGPSAKVLGIGAAGVLALCALGATAGVHAAGGDDASPAVLLAKVLGPSGTSNGDIGTDASGVRPIGDGASDQGGDRSGRAPAKTPPPAPVPTPDATPAPTPTPPPPVDDAPDGPEPRDPSDPLSPEYNPYLTPGDPAFVSDDEKAAWLGREAVVRSCMADAGFEYLDWQWWLGGSPQPAGLTADEATAWSNALRGSANADDGCRAQAMNAAAAAEAAGTPLSAPVPAAPAPDVPTERENWLEFQAAVRSCMAELGYEYRYWEYWNPAFDSPDGSPARPSGLSEMAKAQWNLAAFGDTTDTNAGGGCWATGLGSSGYRTFD
ncbi:hypothetical protein [Agromyces aureus]|uniref:Uncharacterized protein n=1 Tax=Agromyces aureus TaxID=453304 RepID=A0A191WJA8_9MICO|nr:hypothetical protein [Agromyces aureus]ANJ28410.1 hypothetical protein ATC03_18625 [Agromyces aureus]